MNAPVEAKQFQHRHAAHCESGVLSNLLTHHGLPVSEPMVFGLSSALSFAYLPFIQVYGMPLVAYRMPPKAILNGVKKPLGVSFHFETFRSPHPAEQRLDQLLAAGHVVGLQASAYWLPYFPEDMRFHFNAHYLLVYGKDGDDYLISDPVAEMTVRCPRSNLARARFAKGLLAPKGRLFYPDPLDGRQLTSESLRPAVLKAIRKTTRVMLPPPLIPIAGVRGMRLLANKIAGLDPALPHSSQFIGHLVRMQEEIGTGGAGFRFLYAAFLQEAAEKADLPQLAPYAERMLEVGDAWRAFALSAARMVKGRDALDPPRVAAQLRALADLEEAYFRDLARDLKTLAA